MARTTFFVDDPMTRNGVLVMSRAPLETILVRSNDVTGEIDVDPADVTDQPRATFQIPIESLDTGIPMMNDVMRGDRWLDAPKHPIVRFSLGRVITPSSRTPLEHGTTTRVEGEGTLDLRGVSKAVRVHAELTWLGKNDSTARRLPGDVLHVVARFDVSLPAFGVDAHLSAQTLDKVAGTLTIEVDVFASTERPEIGSDMQERLAQSRKSLGQRLLAG